MKNILYLISILGLLCILEHCKTTEEVPIPIVKETQEPEQKIIKKVSKVFIYNNTTCSKYVKIYQNKKLVANTGLIREDKYSRAFTVPIGKCGFYIEDDEDCGTTLNHHAPIEKYYCGANTYWFNIKKLTLIKKRK